MNINITIKNYRCFSQEKPLHIELTQGFLALVGINNSGKSAFLKFFYEFRDLFYKASVSSNFQASLLGFQSLKLGNNINDIDEIFSNFNNENISVEVSISHISKSTNGQLPDSIIFDIPRSREAFKTNIKISGNTLKVNPNQTLSSDRNVYLQISNILVYMEPYFDIFKKLSSIVYIGPFRNAINIGGSDNYFDTRIGQQFISQWDNFKSGDSKSNIKATLKLTQDIGSIFRFQSLEINADINNKNLNVIINGKPYKLDELGSGLAQFIVILANIAITHPSWILIDEPELNLHPSLQIDFLTTLASYSTDGVIFATHNLGLARACAERIYSFRLNSSGISEVKILKQHRDYRNC